MAQLEKSSVTLRIAGESLIPNEITRLLGAVPTQEQTNGQEFVGAKTGQVRVAKIGMWRLQAANREPEDVDGQIREILEQLTNDLSVWSSINERYDVDLFCGLFMGNWNDGFSISAELLAALGARGIEIGFDIYAADDDQEVGE